MAWGINSWPRMKRIQMAVHREETKRDTRKSKTRKPRKERPMKKIRWDRPLPHEIEHA